MFAVWAMVVFSEYGVGNITMCYYLKWAVVIAQLLLGDYIRVVAMHVAINAYDVAHNARYCADVVRDDNNSHLVS